MTYLNPVRHFGSLARGVMLKGVGVEVVYPNLLALVFFTVLLMGVSVWRFASNSTKRVRTASGSDPAMSGSLNHGNLS